MNLNSDEEEEEEEVNADPIFEFEKYLDDKVSPDNTDILKFWEVCAF
jgi:hypothetical protein